MKPSSSNFLYCQYWYVFQRFSPTIFD